MTRSKSTVLLLAVLMCGCSATTLNSVFANAGTNSVQLLPEGGISEQQAQRACSIIDQIAQEDGFARDSKAEELSRSLSEADRLPGYIILHSYSDSQRKIFLNASYSPARSFVVGVNDGTRMSNSNMVRRLEREVAQKLSDAFGKDKVRVERQQYFDFT